MVKHSEGPAIYLENLLPCRVPALQLIKALNITVRRTCTTLSQALRKETFCTSVGLHNPVTLFSKSISLPLCTFTTFVRLCHHSLSLSYSDVLSSLSYLYTLPYTSVPAPPLLRLSVHFLFSVSPQGSRGWHLTKEQMEAPCLPQTLLTHCWTLILPHYCRMMLWPHDRIRLRKWW